MTAEETAATGDLVRRLIGELDVAAIIIEHELVEVADSGRDIAFVGESGFETLAGASELMGGCRDLADDERVAPIEDEVDESKRVQTFFL